MQPCTLRMALSGRGGVLAWMNPIPHSDTRAKLLLRANDVEFREAEKAAIETKANRLFRHEPRILRLRIQVERDLRGRNRDFTAKGLIEVAGPDLTATVAANSGPAAVALLIDKLDRMLRKRTTNLLRGRATDDIRRHVALA